MQGGGVLPSQSIRSLITGGAIRADTPVEDGQIQPASLDLRLGETAWRIRASFLPGGNATVADRLDDFAMHRIDLREGPPGPIAPESIDELADCLGLHLFCGSQGGVAEPPPTLAARLGAGVPIRTAVPGDRGAPDPLAPPIRAPPALS